jgi:hypothetical protein
MGAAGVDFWTAGGTSGMGSVGVGSANARKEDRDGASASEAVSAIANRDMGAGST